MALYEEDCSLQSIADVLNLNPIKVRKLLITAGVYESEVAEKVQDTFERYRKTQDYKTSILSTATVLGLSKASATSYLPYEKGVYFPNTADKEKISVGAERQRRYRAVRKLRTEPTEEHGIQLSIDSGHGGIVTFEAKTDELYDHYIKDFHAVPIFQPHSGGPKLLMLADEGAQEIFSTYLS